MSDDVDDLRDSALDLQKDVSRLEADLQNREARIAELQQIVDSYTAFCKGVGAHVVLAEQAAEIKRLRAIVDKLPKTADGVQKLLSYIYFLAYHRGHDNTCEGCYTHVLHSDAFTYWAEDVDEILQDGTVVSLLNEQARIAASKESKQRPIR